MFEFSHQKATSSTVTPEVANYRAKSAEWVAVNENKYKRPISPHIQIYKYIFLKFYSIKHLLIFLYRFPLQVFSSGFHRATGLMLNGSKKMNFFEIKYILPTLSALHCWSTCISRYWS